MGYSAVRRGFVWAHRYAGLGLAAFLIFEGVTGSLLAFNAKLERVFAPQLYATPKPGAARLSLGGLAEKAEALVPNGQVDYLFAYPNQTFVRVEPRAGLGTHGGTPPLGAATALGFDQLFLDPWTGRELGRREFGDLAQGPMNIMPFVYNLHTDMNAGPTGELILGIVALIWTLDCFVACYLTLPAALRGFWKRWKLAWQVKWNVGAFRLNFDLHRASGLWLWPPLLIFAWSSVMLALPSVYERVTGTFFDYRSDDAVIASYSAHSAVPPKLDWVAAERVGAALLAKQAVHHGFRVVAPPDTLAYIREESVYSYGARTNLDIRGELSDTGVWYDADTGAFRQLFLPRGQHAGNTVSTWLYDLHFADLSNSVAYRTFVFLVGLVITMLSVTGVYIWLKKRNARGFYLRRRTS